VVSRLVVGAAGILAQQPLPARPPAEDASSAGQQLLD
jgi:hypothetical protein